MCGLRWAPMRALTTGVAGVLVLLGACLVVTARWSSTTSGDVVFTLTSWALFVAVALVATCAVLVGVAGSARLLGHPAKRRRRASWYSCCCSRWLRRFPSTLTGIRRASAPLALSRLCRRWCCRSGPEAIGTASTHVHRRLVMSTRVADSARPGVEISAVVRPFSLLALERARQHIAAVSLLSSRHSASGAARQHRCESISHPSSMTIRSPPSHLTSSPVLLSSTAATKSSE
jgi:hypothetical protein